MKIYFSYENSEFLSASPLLDRLKEGGYEILTADTISNASRETISALLSSDLIIALLSSEAANVYFDLGIALGAGLPAIVLATSDVHVPSDMSSYIYVRLTGEATWDAVHLLQSIEKLRATFPKIADRNAPSSTDLVAIAKDYHLIDKISSADFERMVGDLFSKEGWGVERSVIRNGVEIDLLIKEKNDRLALVEVKKVSSQGRVSVDAVRQLVSKMGLVGVSTGVLISTAGFTSSALSLAASSGAVLLTLAQLVSYKWSSVRDLKTVRDEAEKN